MGERREVLHSWTCQRGQLWKPSNLAISMRIYLDFTKKHQCLTNKMFCLPDCSCWRTVYWDELFDRKKEKQQTREKYANREKTLQTANKEKKEYGSFSKVARWDVYILCVSWQCSKSEAGVVNVTIPMASRKRSWAHKTSAPPRVVLIMRPTSFL